MLKLPALEACELEPVNSKSVMASQRSKTLEPKRVSMLSPPWQLEARPECAEEAAPEARVAEPDGPTAVADLLPLKEEPWFEEPDLEPEAWLEEAPEAELPWPEDALPEALDEPREAEELPLAAEDDFDPEEPTEVDDPDLLPLPWLDEPEAPLEPLALLPDAADELFLLDIATVEKTFRRESKTSKPMVGHVFLMPINTPF